LTTEAILSLLRLNSEVIMGTRFAIFVALISINVFTGIMPAAGQVWFPTPAPQGSWQGLALSADGRHQIAVGDAIYVSKNFGLTWNVAFSNEQAWSCAASSANGKTLIAASGFSLYTSTDGGANWSLDEPLGEYWASATVSANGKFMAAVDFYGTLVYTSTNAGVTWVSNTIPTLEDDDIFGLARSIDCSADGTKLALATLGGTIFLSADSGRTWAPSTAPIENWSCITMSAEGKRLYATGYNLDSEVSQIFSSDDSGATWTPTTAPNEAWFSIAASGDGRHLVTCAGGWESTGDIYTSSDFGRSWHRARPPTNYWYAVACSANGNVQTAATFGGNIYLGLR
jgi:hypothetical protein